MNPPGGATVTFLGAAQTVIGSMHLIECGGDRILLDCGITRIGKRRGRQEAVFPFDPATLDAVVLSHAHIDHCGNLANLVRQGFDGPIYCTAATRELTNLMLGDSARIQDEDDLLARRLNDDSRYDPPPVSARSWTQRTIDQCVVLAYEETRSLTPRIAVRLSDAGHLLGSAIVHLMLPEATVTFTGDIGRRGVPFLHEASPVPPADLVISESTYGGRRHQSIDAMAQAMARIVRRSADEGGVVLIPSFSLGRTQLVLHYLCRWKADGILPDLPIFVDSPLAMDIGDVHASHPEAFVRPLLGGRGDVSYLRDVEDGEELAKRRDPYIVVASGGMCEGGRIGGHLRRHIDDPRASLVLVSYQAPDSLGRKLLEKSPKVWFQGRSWNKWIDVVEINGFSGHADHDDLVSYLAPLVGSTGKVRLVHGEPAAGKSLTAALSASGFRDVAMPALGDVVEVRRCAS